MSTRDNRPDREGGTGPRRLLPIVLAVSFLVIAITVRAFYVGGFNVSTIVVVVAIIVVLCGVVLFDLRRR